MENEEIIFYTTKRRESIFKDGDAVSPDEIYPAVYKTNLKTEIDLWTQRFNSVQQECDTLKSKFNSNVEITIDPNIFSKEELDFFDHKLYNEYFVNVNKFCKKVQCLQEIQKQNFQVLRSTINRVHKQIKTIVKQ